MEMAAEKKVGIGFGHTDFQELLPLARLAKDIGVRATLDHPLLELNKLLLDEMKQLRDLGVYVGTYCQPMNAIFFPVARIRRASREVNASSTFSGAIACVK